MRLLVTLAVFLLTVPALAQVPGNCQPGSAEADLDVSDVFARFFNTGRLFFGNATTSGNGYLVPKESGHSPLLAAAFWVGGMMGGELRVAGSTYASFEFWPGPLNEDGTLPNPDDCSVYDRIWVVSAEDVQVYDETGNATPDLAEWPVELGAEVVDGDGVEGNYDLEGGDRPRVYGSQTAFWVINDVGNEHTVTGSPPLGLEVQVTAFAISSADPAFDQATFYRYRLVNRNTLALHDAHFTIWADPDLGDSSDDYAGVDSTRSLGFSYNGDETDSVYGIPPAVGFDLLQDARSFLSYYNASGPIGGNPVQADAKYNTQRGIWHDGTPVTEGGNGYMTDGPVTRWAYPGDAVTSQCWSNVNNCEGGSNSRGNQYFILSSPPFMLVPGEERTFNVALVFAQGSDHLDSITELRAASDLVQDAYDDGSLFDTQLPVAAEDDAAASTAVWLDTVYPNPVRDRATVAFALADPGPVRLAVHDVLGRRVRTLVEGSLAAGEHSASFEAAGLPSGLYLVVLEAEGQRQTQKVLLVR